MGDAKLEANKKKGWGLAGIAVLAGLIYALWRWRGAEAKQYVCPICFDAFKTQEELDAHIQQAHGGLPPSGDAGFSIIVTDSATGVKLSNVVANLYDASQTAYYGQKVTESDGEAHWRDIAPDSYNLVLSKYGYAETSVSVDATAAYPVHEIGMMAEVVPQTATLRVYSGGVGGWQAGYRIYMDGNWITTTGLWGQAIKSGLPLGAHIFSVSPPASETEVLHHYFTNSFGVRVYSSTIVIQGELTEGENVLSIAMR